MRAVDIIRKKRDGHELTQPEIEAFVAGTTSGAWPDYQVAALLMAIMLRDMSFQETAWLTAAMVRSGVRLDLADIPGPKVDKHSTGGVGDKTSLVVVPLAAACGLVVPKMAGRGLGHSGGTLDKLEAIPGFRVGLSLDELRSALRRISCALLGQTKEIAPADTRLYSLRDVTATVESMPLIAASVMSKKIAEGIEALVLDVKCGRGAFMKTLADARRLGEALVAIGRANGVRTEAVLTAMDQPLGRAVGNALEVIECLEALKGQGPKDLETLAVTLAARMVRLGGVVTTEQEAEARVREALTSGRGLDKFREVIAHQGGDARVVDDYGLLPTAPHRTVFAAERSGHVTGLDAELIGRAAMALGAGRDKVGDAIDSAVGVVVRVHQGASVRAGEALGELHYRDGSRLATALGLMQQACLIGDEPPASQELILGVIR